MTNCKGSGGAGSEPSSCCTVDRRSVAQGIALAGCALIALGRSGVRADESSVADLRPGDRFAIEPEAGEPKALKFDDFKPGVAVMGAYPLDPATGKLRTSSRLNVVNIMRMSGAPKGELARTNGLAVFSAICTHKGCTISSWQPDVNHWRCFCHMSEFDAAAKGERVDGPATEPLPVVPIAIDAEGYITATAGFSAAPGAAG